MNETLEPRSDQNDEDPRRRHQADNRRDGKTDPFIPIGTEIPESTHSGPECSLPCCHERPYTPGAFEHQSIQDNYAPSVLATFSNWETAVRTCAGANGFGTNMLFGTPNEDHSCPSDPVI